MATQIKVFKTNVTEVVDSNTIEAKVNGFIKTKNVINIVQTQSYNPETKAALLVITVIYDTEKKEA